MPHTGCAPQVVVRRQRRCVTPRRCARRSDAHRSRQRQRTARQSTGLPTELIARSLASQCRTTATQQRTTRHTPPDDARFNNHVDGTDERTFLFGDTRISDRHASHVQYRHDEHNQRLQPSTLPIHYPQRTAARSRDRQRSPHNRSTRQIRQIPPLNAASVRQRVRRQQSTATLFAIGSAY